MPNESSRFAIGHATILTKSASGSLELDRPSGTGHTPIRSHPEWWRGDIPWIGIKDANTHHSRVIYDTIQHTNTEGLANSAARLLAAGTVCLSRTASFGYVVIMGKDMATSQDFVTWTFTEAIEPRYLMYAIMAEGEEMRRFGKRDLPIL
jgi:type I restriction enzyme, S subunit